MIRVPALYLRSWQLSATVCSSFLSKPEKSSTRASVSSCIICKLLFHQVLRITSRGYRVPVPVSLQDLFYHNRCSDDSPCLQGRGFLNDVAVSSHGLLKDIHTSIMVPVHHQATLRTFIHPNRQGHLLPMPTGRTGLRRVGRVHTDHFSTSFLRFVQKHPHEGRPGRICDGLCQFGIFDHRAHTQGFQGNQPVGADQTSGLLLDEVLAPLPDTLMDTRHDLASLLPSLRALLF